MSCLEEELRIRRQNEEIPARKLKKEERICSVEHQLAALKNYVSQILEAAKEQKR